MTLNARQKQFHTFSIDIYSEVDEKRYTGSFTIKKMGIRDLAAMGVRKAQLNGGMHYDAENPGRGVDESTDNMNNMIATLEVTVKKAPEWWDLDNITDWDVVGKVFQEVVSFENSFLSRKADRALDGRDGEGSGEGDIPPADNAGGPRHVVGAEVQTALEP